MEEEVAEHAAQLLPLLDVPQRESLEADLFKVVPTCQPAPWSPPHLAQVVPGGLLFILAQHVDGHAMLCRLLELGPATRFNNGF